MIRVLYLEKEFQEFSKKKEKEFQEPTIQETEDDDSVEIMGHHSPWTREK